MRGKMLIYLALLCAMLLAAGWMAQQAQIIADERARLQQEILTLEAENVRLRGRIAELKQQQAEIGNRMQSWLDTWEVELWESTAYAPLDSRAIPGMCYSGDPRITTSGAKTTPGVTAAAGPDVEFGTKAYVAGDGPRVVQDRGERIGNRNIDLAMATREEALAWGRRRVLVIWERRQVN